MYRPTIWHDPMLSNGSVWIRNESRFWQSPNLEKDLPHMIQKMETFAQEIFKSCGSLQQFIMNLPPHLPTLLELEHLDLHAPSPGMWGEVVGDSLWIAKEFQWFLVDLLQVNCHSLLFLLFLSEVSLPGIMHFVFLF